MTARALVPLLLLFASTAPALADETTYLVRRNLSTGHVVNLLTGDSERFVEGKLERMYRSELRGVNRAIRRADGRLLVANLHKYRPTRWDVLDGDVSGWFVKNGAHKIHQRRGQLVVLYRAPSDEAPLDGAVAIPADTQVKLDLSAHAGEEELARGSGVVSLDELDALAAGQPSDRLLRGWNKLVGERSDEPDLKARLEIPLDALTPAHTTTRARWTVTTRVSVAEEGVPAVARFPSETVEAILGRSGRARASSGAIGAFNR